MADTAKMTCSLDACTYGAEVKASWKLGRGADIPFLGGKVGADDGLHFHLQLCKAHRKTALAMPNRPYRVTMTAWHQKAAEYGITFDPDGNMLLPGVAVAAKRDGAAVKST